MTRLPDGLPVLGPGRHFRKRNGVCLMEFTSILAGERFSDHPRCTDPALATVARAVNDYSTDSGRQRLSILASDLTAAAPAGSEVGYGLARRCLLTALPFATGERRRVVVVGLLGLDRAARGRTRGWRRGLLDVDTELALLSDAAEVDAAAAFLREMRVSPREYIRRGLPVAIEAAVRTIAREADNPDDVLAAMLTGCIGDVRRRASGAQVPSVSCAESSDTSANSPRST
jgi:hypothetical protein